jgi:mannose-1-phosphate guanylyltransferase
MVARTNLQDMDTELATVPKRSDDKAPSGAMANVVGIVLAGTHAWGESPLELVCSRPLWPVAGRPLVAYSLDWLASGGVRNACICANSDTTVFRRCLGDGAFAGLSLHYYEDPMPRGPAGCARDAALQSGADLFVVVEGALLPQVDLRAMLEAHRASNAALTLAVSPPANGDGDPTRGHEPAGIYVATRAVLEQVPANGYQDIKEMLVPRLYQGGASVLSWPVPPGASVRVRDLTSYLAANDRAMEALAIGCLSRAPYVRVEEGWAHKSAQIDETACVVGPVLIGPGSRIGRSVTLIGPTVIDAGCEIERDVVISNTAIWSGCRVGAGAIVNHCVLATGTWIEPELVVASTVTGADRPDVVRSVHGVTSYWRLEPDGADGRSPDEPDAGTPQSLMPLTPMRSANCKKPSTAS